MPEMVSDACTIRLFNFWWMVYFIKTWWCDRHIAWLSLLDSRHGCKIYMLFIDVFSVTKHSSRPRCENSSAYRKRIHPTMAASGRWCATISPFFHLGLSSPPAASCREFPLPAASSTPSCPYSPSYPPRASLVGCGITLGSGVFNRVRESSVMADLEMEDPSSWLSESPWWGAGRHCLGGWDWRWWDRSRLGVYLPESCHMRARA